jgi:hypothetical protein
MPRSLPINSAKAAAVWLPLRLATQGTVRLLYVKCPAWRSSAEPRVLCVPLRLFFAFLLGLSPAPHYCGSFGRHQTFGYRSATSRTYATVIARCHVPRKSGRGGVAAATAHLCATTRCKAIGAGCGLPHPAPSVHGLKKARVRFTLPPKGGGPRRLDICGRSPPGSAAAELPPLPGGGIFHARLLCRWKGGCWATTLQGADLYVSTSRDTRETRRADLAGAGSALRLRRAGEGGVRLA